VSAELIIGDGENSFFWQDRWLDGRCLGELVLELGTDVSLRRRKWTIVVVGLRNNGWIRDIMGPLTVEVLIQYLELRERLEALCYMNMYQTDWFGNGACWWFLSQADKSASI
jgi:hypothetical protein